MCAIFPSMTSSQVVNDRNPYSNTNGCDAYIEFLKGRELETLGGCDGIARFVMENALVPIPRFLESYIERTPSSSGLRFLLIALERRLVEKNGISAYHGFDIADRELFMRLSTAGDQERAYLYSGLIGRIKTKIFQENCKAGVCERFPVQLKISEILGTEYSTLDEIEAINFTGNRVRHAVVLGLDHTQAAAQPVDVDAVSDFKDMRHVM